MQGTSPLAEEAVSTVPVPRGATHPDASSLKELVLRPQSGWIGVNWRELFERRELLYFFVWRDIKVRYAQTALGVAWGLLQPLMMMLIFSFIFGRFAKIPSDGIPYSLFVFAGLLPWTLYANGVTQGGQSLINQQSMLTKVYLPRLFLPTAAVGVFLVDLVTSFLLYGVILAWYSYVPRLTTLVVPGLVLLTMLFTLGCTYILSAVTLLYRDFRFLIPFFVQIMMYLSPVIYPARMLPRRLQPIVNLNPLVGIIESFRSAILGTPWNIPALLTSIVMSLAIFVLGLFYFRKIERRFADIA